MNNNTMASGGISGTSASSELIVIWGVGRDEAAPIVYICGDAMQTADVSHNRRARGSA